MSDISYDSVRALFSKYGIALSHEEFEQFATYAQLLSEEKSVQNVTRVNDPVEIWTRHFLDSAYLICYLREQPCKSLLDLGTGGGFPGIPLAILCPDLTVTLLDSEEKKLDFCASVVRRLGLSVNCLCGRAEELANQQTYREQFDFVASRAVANGSMLCELALPFLKIGGTFFAFKGSGYDLVTERFAEASQAMQADAPQVIDYELEGVAKHLIMIGKSQPTPTSFPRRFAKMKRSPL